MKKTIKAISAFLLLSSVSILAGCFNDEDKGVVGRLKISVFEGGAGNTAFYELANKYIELNPGANVEIEYSTIVRDDCQNVVEGLQTSTDIFFVDGCTVPKAIEEYHTLFDMTELYSSKPKAGNKEENITIAEKIKPEVLEMMKYQGDQAAYKNKYFTAPWVSGPCSLILNVDAINSALGEGGWETPRTTNELLMLCNRIKAANATVTISGQSKTVYPFTYGGSATDGAIDYWRYLYYTWIAQLMGVNRFNEEFVSLKINGQYNENAYFSNEKKAGLQELEKFIKYTNGYCMPNSSSYSFTDAQGHFLRGEACMFVTGDWLEREMEGTRYQPNLKMIQTPVISSVVDKFESKFSKPLGANSEEKETALAAIIKSIDEGNSSYNGLTEAEYNYFKETRGYTYTLASGSYCLIPECSVNKELALDFLRFFYSDEAIQINLDDTKMLLPVINPQNYQLTDTPSSFRSSVNEIRYLNYTTDICFTQNDPIRYRAGLGEYVSIEEPERALGKKTNAQTAEQYLANEKRILDPLWSGYLSNVQ